MSDFLSRALGLLGRPEEPEIEDQPASREVPVEAGELATAADIQSLFGGEIRDGDGSPWPTDWSGFEVEEEIPATVDFGKHQGERIDRVPADYLDWLLKSEWVGEHRPALKDEIRSWRARH